MRNIAIIAAILIAVAAGSAFLYFRIQPDPQPEQLIYGSGRIEVDEVRLAPEVSGRLLQNRAREGETVRFGTLVATLEPEVYQLQAEQAAAQQQAVRQTIAQIDAQIERARHHSQTAREELSRYEALRREGWVTVPQVDLRRNASVAASNEVTVLQQQRAQAAAQTAAADRSLALARERLGQTELRAPIAGAVLQRLAEPGEVVAPGQPIAILGNLAIVRLKVFVAERDVGKLRLGAAARMRVDAFPDTFFTARVARIDPQAQFTPRDVHMEDERARTVYGVTLEAANPKGFLKPGMPADVWILWDDARGWPARLVVPE